MQVNTSIYFDGTLVVKMQETVAMATTHHRGHAGVPLDSPRAWSETRWTRNDVGSLDSASEITILSSG